MLFFFSFELVLGILNIIMLFHAFLSIDKMHIKSYIKITDFSFETALEVSTIFNTASLRNYSLKKKNGENVYFKFNKS